MYLVGFAVTALLASSLMRYVFPSQPRVQNILRCAPGLKEPRYLAFALAFGICASSYTLCVGSFDGTAANPLLPGLGSKSTRKLVTPIIPFLSNEHEHEYEQENRMSMRMK